MLICSYAVLDTVLLLNEQFVTNAIKEGLTESMMGLRPRQGNLRLVFRLFSLMRGLPSIRLE